MVLQKTDFKLALAKVAGQPIEKMGWPVLALDPGDTTGWAVFDQGELKASGQSTGDARDIENLINYWMPTVVVMEEYRIYAWKVKQHTWSTVPTLQLIGAITYICQRQNIPCVLQSAQVAKGFATNDKLMDWGLWQSSARHANDAIRHGVYYLLCNKAGPRRR